MVSSDRSKRFDRIDPSSFITRAFRYLVLTRWTPVLFQLKCKLFLFLCYLADVKAVITMYAGKKVQLSQSPIGLLIALPSINIYHGGVKGLVRGARSTAAPAAAAGSPLETTIAATTGERVMERTEPQETDSNILKDVEAGETGSEGEKRKTCISNFLLPPPHVYSLVLGEGLEAASKRKYRVTPSASTTPINHLQHPQTHTHTHTQTEEPFIAPGPPQPSSF